MDVELRYWQLLRSRVGAAEACLWVGITRKAGYRWLAEHGGVPLVRPGEEARYHRRLSLLERLALVHAVGCCTRRRCVPGRTLVGGLRAARRPRSARSQDRIALPSNRKSGRRARHLDRG